MYGVAAGTIKPRATAILEQLGLDADRYGCPMEELSRGQQQKVAIARALLTSPTFVLLDEPTTGLDPKSKRDVQSFVLNLRRTHDASVLICTHDMREASDLCDRIAIIDRGVLIDVGSAQELVARHGARDLEDVFFRLTGGGLRVEEVTG